MIRAMTTAASGMKAQQLNIDTIANNLANVNTAGFKKSTAEFQDLLYEAVVPTGSTRGSGLAAPARVEVGHGVKLVATDKMFTQGQMRQTGNPLDLMIEGDGFFQIKLPDGSLAYTRDGSFKLDGERNLVTAAGYYLEPAIQIPLDATEISVARDGTVSVTLAGDGSHRAGPRAGSKWPSSPTRPACAAAAATCSSSRRPAARRCAACRARRGSARSRPVSWRWPTSRRSRNWSA